MTKKELGEQVEQLQVQLAGCLVAAQGHTKNPAKEGDYGWSPAYQDVLELRIKFDSPQEELKLEKRADNTDKARSLIDVIHNMKKALKR